MVTNFLISMRAGRADTGGGEDKSAIGKGTGVGGDSDSCDALLDIRIIYIPNESLAVLSTSKYARFCVTHGSSDLFLAFLRLELA